MSNELITILGVGIALAVMMNTQIRNLRADLTKRLDGQAIEIAATKADLIQRFDYKFDALDKRLDDQAVVIGAIKKEISALREGQHALGERMARLEGLVEGLKEAVVARFAA